MKRSIAALCSVLLLLAGGSSLGAAPGDLADAAMRGDAAAVRALLGENADVNEPQVDGATALHWAVYRDDVETAELLIAAGANVSAPTREGVTPLYMASLYGSPRMVQRLLEAGADANEPGPNGYTSLMLAARNGNPETIRLLVAAGGEVNAAEPVRGTTPLMWAVTQGHAEAVRVLLEAGADHSAVSAPAGLPRNYMANRVNTVAVQQAQERLRALLAAGLTPEEIQARQTGAASEQSSGIDLNTVATFLIDQARSAGGQIPAAADIVAGFESQAATLGIDVVALRGVVEQQLGGAAAPPPADAEEEEEGPVAGLVGGGGGRLTPLVFAAREGNLEAARLLVEAGADVNQTTEFGWTPLLTATNNRNYQVGRYLIEQGADVNLAHRGGMTPLYLATDNRNIEGGDYPVPEADLDHLEFIRLLLEAGADPNHQVSSNTDTRTIFTMQWFFEAGATAFVRAAQSGDTALLKLLLEFGADPMIRTDYGDTALSAAAGIGWVEGVTFEWSPEENLEAVRMLLELGLDPNSANTDGRTPLMGAALKGRNDVIRLLVDSGARLETRDRGSRDTDKSASKLAGHTWQALDYADGLVRVGVQSAVNWPETAALIRELMMERGLPVPPPNRTVESICIVAICMDEPIALQ